MIYSPGAAPRAEPSGRYQVNISHTPQGTRKQHAYFSLVRFPNFLIPSRCLFPRTSNCLMSNSKIWKLVNSCGIVKTKVLRERGE